jgi:outer membrane immunogenic protein
MKAKIIAAVIAATALPAAAHAEDFLGGRIGIVGGWDQVDVDVNNIGPNGRYDYSKKYDDITFGLLTGYHWALAPGWIIGIGTSTMFSDGSKKFSVPGPQINPPPPGGVVSGTTNTLKLEAKRDLEAHVKIGAVVSDYALIYGKIGYANAKVKATANINGIEYDESDTGSGFRLGVGTEIALNEKFSFTTEYRYTDYSKHITRQQVVAGFYYKF